MQQVNMAELTGLSDMDIIHIPHLSFFSIVSSSVVNEFEPQAIYLPFLTTIESLTVGRVRVRSVCLLDSYRKVVLP